MFTAQIWMSHQCDHLSPFSSGGDNDSVSTRMRSIRWDACGVNFPFPFTRNFHITHLSFCCLYGMVQHFQLEGATEIRPIQAAFSCQVKILCNIFMIQCFKVSNQVKSHQTLFVQPKNANYQLSHGGFINCTDVTPSALKPLNRMRKT